MTFPETPGIPPQDAPAPPAAPPRSEVRSPLSDGAWHRLHPLTPLMKGGLFLVVVIGIVVANLRDRVIAFFVPGGEDWGEYQGDPFDFIVANNLILVAALVVLGVLLILLGLFWVSWRFHQFRITDDDVEVRNGVLFRTHRRAPLDRVQGVNLTRPMVARLLGMAKLEVVGAGLDANVKLEYLSTSNAETIRGDILRLASGRRLADGAGTGAGRQALGATVAAGVHGLIEGAEIEEEPASVVHIPAGRLIAAQLLSLSTLWLLALIVAIVVGSILGTPWVLFSLVPAVIGFGVYWFKQVTQSLRYSIAPTGAGVRITYGLFSTITETLPPGRVHAFQIRQPILWRRFGWWAIRVNRLSGRAATDTSSLQFADVLPVGTAEDVHRVMRLFDPGLDDATWAELYRHGMRADPVEDPYTTTPRRARWLRPFSWRRNGFLLTPDTLLLRSGVLRRVLVLLPLARLQSIRISQGPVDRALDVAGITGNTVLGQVSGALGVLDRTATFRLWQDAAASVIVAAAHDHSHRWSAEAEAPQGVIEADAGGPHSPETSATADDQPTSRADARRAREAAERVTAAPEDAP